VQHRAIKDESILLGPSEKNHIIFMVNAFFDFSNIWVYAIIAGFNILFSILLSAEASLMHIHWL